MKRAAVLLLALAVLLAVLAVAACSGPAPAADPVSAAAQVATPAAGPAGPQGPAGPAGPAGPQGPAGPAGASAISSTLETCTICHKRTGADHQTFYNQLYQDGVIQVSNIKYAFTPSPNTTTITFKLTKNGQPFDPKQADALSIYFAPYAKGKFQFDPPADRLSLLGKLTADGAGNVTSTLVEKAKDAKDYVAYSDVSGTPGLIVIYGRDETVGTIPGTRLTQNKYPFAALMKTGGGVDYVSAANVSGCEKCHTTPYLKHAYIYGQVGGDKATDFYTCKVCHLDNGEGGHFEWQLLVNEPTVAPGYLAGDVKLTDAQTKQYAYNTSVMNDVHMSHAMEFPYPQSMANCVTCHEGKLDTILTDANFKISTCKSCHPETGAKAAAKEGEQPAYDTTKLALKTILPESIHGKMDLNTTDCTSCHGEGKAAASFKKIHSGYDKAIYTAAGVRYSDAISVTIDSATLNGTTLDVKFKANQKPDFKDVDSTTITPTVLVGLYGYDTKDFIVGPHERSFDDNKDGKIDSKDQRNLEAEVGTDHPRIKTVSAAGGSWEVQADLSAWDDMIKAGTVKRVQIGVLPALVNADKVAVAVSAVSRTFDLGGNKFDDKAFSTIAAAQKCESCHDALGTTFHQPSYGGDVTVCRMCHTPKTGAGHLEMQSRSIDSYVHAIHSGQDFDVASINFKDPVEALHYEEHVGSPYPKHAITDCESCHMKGTYNAPDQSASLPGLLSASAKNDSWNRNIGAVPSYVTGPATRACGGCHRAQNINEDKAGGLAVLNQHFRQGGYLIEAGDKPADTLQSVFDQVMALFK